MKKRMKTLLALAVVLVLCLSCCLGAFAHSLTIESLGGTYVSFSYSDGTVCKGAKIIVQDASGATIGSGKTNSSGVYNYAEFEGTAAKIVMNDGEGHVGDYVVPEVTPEITDRTPVEKTEAPAEKTDTAPATTETTADTAPVETIVSAPTETASSASTSSGGMSAGTIVAVIIVVAVLVAIAVLTAMRSKKKK